MYCRCLGAGADLPAPGRSQEQAAAGLQAGVSGNMGPGWPDPLILQRNQQFGSFLVFKYWLSIYAHIFIFTVLYGGIIYIWQNAQILSMELDEF